MTGEEAVADLKANFGAENVALQDLQTEPGIVLAIVTRPQPVPNRELSSQVAFKLPAQINGRPPHFVEPHLVLPSGGQPNNSNTQELNGKLWKTWSLNTSWDPAKHSLSQLVATVLKQWDR